MNKEPSREPPDRSVPDWVFAPDLCVCCSKWETIEVFGVPDPSDISVLVHCTECGLRGSYDGTEEEFENLAETFDEYTFFCPKCENPVRYDVYEQQFLCQDDNCGWQGDLDQVPSTIDILIVALKEKGWEHHTEGDSEKLFFRVGHYESLTIDLSRNDLAASYITEHRVMIKSLEIKPLIRALNVRLLESSMSPVIDDRPGTLKFLEAKENG